MKLHRIIITICISILLSMFCLPAFAAEWSGTLYLHCSTHVDGERFYIAEDEFSIVRIADAEVLMSEGNSHIRYTILPKYKNIDCDWGNLTAEESRAKAKQLTSMVADEEYIASDETDRQGNASFYNLDPAIYLVVRTKVTPQNESYYVDPFLVSVPLLWDGSINYTVTTSPKCGWNPEDSDPPSNPIVPADPSDSKLPQTGQLNWPIPVLIIVGIALVIIGWKRYRQSKNK